MVKDSRGYRKISKSRFKLPPNTKEKGETGFSDDNKAQQGHGQARRRQAKKVEACEETLPHASFTPTREFQRESGDWLVAPRGLLFPNEISPMDRSPSDDPIGVFINQKEFQKNHVEKKFAKKIIPKKVIGDEVISI